MKNIYIAAVFVLAAIFISAPVFTFAEEAQSEENTAVLCTDGIDNDFNSLVDQADPGCANFAVVPTPTPTPTPALSFGTPENTAELCNNNIDDDFNSLTDISDPKCAGLVPVTPPATEVPPQTGGGSPKIDVPAPLPTPTPVVATGTSGTPAGEVLGASTSDTATVTAPTSCSPYLTSYLKFGKNNDKAQVIKLQTFLNNTLKLKIPVTGFFGTQTRNAVTALQNKYADQILLPWVKAGVSKDADASGYVFKSTKWFINDQFAGCKGATPFPVLGY